MRYIITSVLLTVTLIFATATQTGAISGFVKDEATQQPIRGAFVFASGPSQGMDTTCQMGGYNIPNLLPGRYEVRAHAPGYELRVFPESVLAIAGQTIPNINFFLRRTAQNGAISGFVKDEATQQPIQGAIVIATGPNQGTATTCQMGGYLIPNLIPGRYEVSAQAQGYEPRVFPESVLVVAGETTRNINLFLRRVGQNGTISGRVFDHATQAPIENALVVAQGPNGRGEARTCQMGGYNIPNLPLGRYQVCASKEGYLPIIYPESVEVHPGQTTPNIDFYLNRGPQPSGIAGKVIDIPNHRPIANALIIAEGPVRREVRTNWHGDYFIGEIPPGSYRVSANALGYRPEVRESVMVYPNKTTHINFALEPIPQYGGISGTVVDLQTHQPIEHTSITIEGPSRAMVETNREGFYIIINLPPGEYRVTAQAPNYRPETRERVMVHPGATTLDVNFALERMAQTGMIGKVVNAQTNQPIENALITAVGPVRVEVMTNRNGDFGFMGIQPGIYQVTAQARGYEPQTLDSVIVHPDRITDHVDFFIIPDTSDNVTGESFSLHEGLNISVSPNPCVKFARINVSANNHTTLKVYDASGKLITTLWQGEGKTEVVWHRTDARGKEVNSGTYFISIENGTDRKIAKVVVQ